MRKPSREATQSQSLRNADKAVDAWIDELDIDFESNLNPAMSSENMTLRLLAYQGLPRLNISPFNGSPEDWIDFVINFRDLIHLQAHLSNTEKMSYLLQHLEGEARRAVIGYSRDKFGYVRALKRLKYLFGQPSRVAQAHLSKVTKGKQIGNDDQVALSEYYYTINDCLVTLRRMCYFSDLYSTDVLRQAVRRLPSRLQERWCEYSLKIRRQEEPNLQHLEEWLQDRVLASMDPYMPAIQSDRQQRSSRPPRNSKPISRSKLTTLATMTAEVEGTKGGNTPSLCPLCSIKHKLFRCSVFLGKPLSERRKLVKEKKLCFNCLNSDHMVKKCKSQYSCKDCYKRHHSSLHEHSEQKGDSNLSKKKNSNSARPNISEASVATKQGKTQSCANATNDSPIVGMMTSNSQQVFLQIVEVEVQTKNGG